MRISLGAQPHRRLFMAPIAELEPDARASGWLPLHIATDRCKGCELCVTECPKHVLALDRSWVNALGYHPVVLTDAAACTSCALCARICPDAVFTVYAPPKGTQR